MLHFGIHTGLYFHYVDGNPFSVETCHDWSQFIIRDPVPSSKAQRSFLASRPTSPRGFFLPFQVTFAQDNPRGFFLKKKKKIKSETTVFILPDCWLFTMYVMSLNYSYPEKWWLWNGWKKQKASLVMWLRSISRSPYIFSQDKQILLFSAELKKIKNVVISILFIVWK